MKKIIYISLFLFVLSGQAIAQESTLMSFMRQSPQSLRTNPANLSDSVRWYMGMPLLLSPFKLDLDLGVRYSDVISRRADNSLVVNPDIVDALSSARMLMGFNYELFSFGVRFQQRHMVTFSLSAVGDVSFLFPSDLATLLVKGNTAGKQLSIETEVNASAYMETALGYTFAINKDWKVGARTKLLSGAANAYGKNLYATMDTDPVDYKMLLNTNALVKTSYVDNPGDIFNNAGFAFDAGAYYQTPIKELNVGLSFVDWGWINWNSNLQFYEAKTQGDGFEFAGLSDTDTDLSEIADTLKNVFKFSEMPGKSYRTTLPGKVFVSATYDFSPNEKLGFLFSTRALDSFSRTTFTLMYNRSVGDWLVVAAGNNFMTTKLFNPSIALNFKAKAFQFYIAAENISSFEAINSRTLNVQLGMNFAFFDR
ncbi:MAG: DUF5723 family protein [Dysgonamonadaceae bacterium]|jgi:hypothetical protein|nr:DUF5723 family protein [Dysgonamonadaceae bacterium]